MSAGNQRRGSALASQSVAKAAVFLASSAALTRGFWAIFHGRLDNAGIIEALCGVAAVSSTSKLLSFIPQFRSWNVHPPLSLSLMALTRELIDARSFPFWKTAATHVVHNSSFVWLFRYVSAGTLRGWKKILSPRTGVLLDSLQRLGSAEDEGAVMPACNDWHPGHSCAANALHEFFHLFVYDLPYITLTYLLPTLLRSVRRKQMPTGTQLRQLVVDILRSNFVIACLPIALLHVFCLCRSLHGHSASQSYPRPWFTHALLSSLLSACVFHLERPPRRTALQAFAHWRMAELFLAFSLDLIAARTSFRLLPRQQRYVFASLLVFVVLLLRHRATPFRTPFLSQIASTCFPK